ncbi:hypothetical protein MWU77_17330 [Rhodococcus sp. F64268]|nr:hypothetical protein [Rhodococcus sp. F64268]MCK0092542.1 hypothetical protein [Rhodococcus sp. F64268]
MAIASGSEFSFLRGGDHVTLRAPAPGPDGEVIRFDECSGRIVAFESG